MRAHTPDTVEATPLMQQWRALKARHPDALLLFRVGDFYEMFYDDAVRGAELLQITLTSRNNGSSRAPLAGIPAHALGAYLKRLLAAGVRVAICEQMEDPAQAKGVVRREVVEVLSPGAVLRDGLLDERRPNHLVALAGDPHGGIGYACADLSTGDLTLGVTEAAALADVLARLEPAELLLPADWPEPENVRATITRRAASLFDPAVATSELMRRYGVQSLAGFGLGPGERPAVAAAGALVAYWSELLVGVAPPLRPPRVERPGDVVTLDARTQRNLELVEALAGPDRPSLLRVLDRTRTPMGARTLRRWLLAPLRQRRTLEERLDAVAYFVERDTVRHALQRALAKLPDLERLAVKARTGRATPRDLGAVRDTLARFPEIAAALPADQPAALAAARAALDPLPELHARLAQALVDEPPPHLGEGAVFRPGFDPELDALRQAREDAVDFLARLQERERARTGIPSLKVGFHRVFGYYLEVTRAHRDRVPPDYEHRQTLAQAERFVTPELKAWEAKIVEAEARLATLEQERFQALRAEVAEAASTLLQAADALGRLDAWLALADVAGRYGYTRPYLHDGFGLRIRAGRHPVVERALPPGAFIPNDVELDENRRLAILTGPNMAGKSTVLRMVGTIVLLAQIGSFVPAEEASVGLVDRIFTRVGATDDLAAGQSTFMVEMTETAAILHSATDRSLVLLDEIGRGTATWDGLAVATAVAEHLHDIVRAKTIFATHYHELTRLAERCPGVVLWRVAVREEQDRVVFLHRLEPGAADRAYGIEVARLAGLPAAVVERARALLQELERRGHEPPARRAGGESAVQLSLFPVPPEIDALLDRLRRLEIHQLTPLQALLLLAELSEAARRYRDV